MNTLEDMGKKSTHLHILRMNMSKENIIVNKKIKFLARKSQDTRI